LDSFGSASHLLLVCRDFRRRKRVGMGGKRLRIGAAELVGPASVVLDDLIGDLVHRILRCLFDRPPGPDMERFGSNGNCQSDSRKVETVFPSGIATSKTLPGSLLRS